VVNERRSIPEAAVGEDELPDRNAEMPWSAFGSIAFGQWKQSRCFPPKYLDIDLLVDLNGIIDLDAEGVTTGRISASESLLARSAAQLGGTAGLRRWCSVTL
jgi:hypothetical protein